MSAATALVPRSARVDAGRAACIFTACLVIILVGCSPHDRRAPDAAGSLLGAGEFEGLPTGFEQWKRVCATGYGDAVTRKFCGGDEPPSITSLAQLRDLLELQLYDGAHGVVLTGQSTGIGLRTVTPLNPRAIVFPSYLSPLAFTFTILAFARGEPLVELIALDPSAETLRFFVLRFHPSCESTDGCNFADLLTETIESNWTGYTLYDEETIKNTPLDCLACHQTGGPGTRKILRMQELRMPWNHWFASNSMPPPNSPEANFRATHVNEAYAGITSGRFSSPGELEMFLSSRGYDFQPNQYDSGTINAELAQSGSSPTWQALYDRAVGGLAIPPPYVGIDQTDPEKITPMITAYQQVATGALARELLPDIRDTLLESALPAMSIRPKPTLDGRGILVHICSRCHNSRLDQTQTRARFNVDTLDTLSRAEKDLAIARLQLDDDNPRKMPPVRFHVLSPSERDLVTQALSQ